MFALGEDGYLKVLSRDFSIREVKLNREINAIYNPKFVPQEL